jgi:hypothetical protein
VAINKERVAGILERDVSPTIKDWMSRVESNAELTALFLSYEERTSHLAHLLGDLVRRLRLAPNTSVPISGAAWKHGGGCSDARKDTPSQWWWRSRASCSEYLQYIAA